MPGITHHRIAKSQVLSSWAVSLGLKGSEFDVLLDLGAIYVNGERTRSNVELSPDDIIRLHSQPRRFPIQEVRIIADEPDFIVIDKPAGLPCHATLDNAKENVLAILEAKFKQRLYLPHRLDNLTSGILLIAKSSPACAKLSEQLSGAEKIYEAVVRNGERLSPGLVTHFMKNSDRAPKQVSKVEISDSKKCQLEILKITKYGDHQFKVQIRLITGRTHQIRAQLADLGAPIDGDNLYSKESEEKPLLRATELRFDRFEFNV